MSENTTTPYSNQASILADLWINYRADENFQDFIEYNDIGLPLAYAISNGIVSTSPLAEQFITETFDLFLSGLDVEDTGFDTIDDVFAIAE